MSREILIDFDKLKIYIYGFVINRLGIPQKFSYNEICHIGNHFGPDWWMYGRLVKVDMTFHPLPHIFMTVVNYLDHNHKQLIVRMIEKLLLHEKKVNQTFIINVFRRATEELLVSTEFAPAIYKKDIENDIQALKDELERLNSFVECISSSSYTTLELHVEEKIPSGKPQNNGELFHLVGVHEVNATRLFKDGVQWDQHGGVGYHFHYCIRKNTTSFERTRYLLSYNTDQDEHLGSSPVLYSETHGENNASSNANLPQTSDRRRAIYHQCNSKRLELLRKDQRIPFRCKSKKADFYYQQ